MFFKKNRDFFEIILYLFISIILVYYVPSPFNKLIFLGVLPLVWRTKKDYLWLAFFFIVEDIPGGLFSGGFASDVYRMPIYTIVPGISVTIRELYLILIFIKVLYKPEYKKEHQVNNFSRELSLAGYYLIFLLLISTLIGMSFDAYRDFYKICIGFTLFISVPRIFPNRENFIKFLQILFPFTIIAILLQVYSLTFGQQLIAVFKPGVFTAQGILSVSGSMGSWQRPIEMMHVLLVCFAGSLFLLNKGERSFTPGYLVAINFLSFLGIFLTGTRSWFLALVVMYFYLFLTRLNQISYRFIRKILITSILIAGISLVPVINKQVSNAWDRLSTLEKVTEGDITAGGTSSRFDVRAPRVMEGFKASTIISGAGFTKLFYQYQDGHVGYQNMLLNAGIMGMLIFTIIFAKALILPYSLSKLKTITVGSKNELRSSCLLLIALLVINIGTQTLGYTPDGGNRFFLMILALIFINQAINSVLTEYQAKATYHYQQ